MNDNDVLSAHYHKADRVMVFIIWGLFVYALALAFWYSTWVEALVIGGGSAVILSVVYSMAAGTRLSRFAMAAGFMVMTALHIHQARGMIEIHFGVFALLAMLLYYRDAMPVLVAAGVIAVHHLAFFYIQTNGGAVWVLENANASVLVILLHAGYVVVETALLVWFAINLKKEALESSEVMSVTNRIIAGDQINLGLRTSGRTALLQRFDQYTEDVEHLAHDVKTWAEQLNSEGQHLTETVSKMSEATRFQTRETQAITEAVSQLNQAISDVSSSSEHASQAAKEVNDHAQDATRVSRKTMATVEDLAQQVVQAQAAIEELNQHSTGIGAVLSVIRGVAEQTNLLALNAAIEAARAGEQGRGFAVVADEVRMLAQRTQQSTQEIDKLIETLQTGSENAVSVMANSREKAQLCVQNTADSLEFMTQVSRSIQDINEMVNSIAAAATEQSAVAAEVNHNVENILATSNRTQANAAEADTSAVAVGKVSLALAKLTNRFLVSEAR